MAATSDLKIPRNKLKADTLRAICRDFGANSGKRKRMLEFLRAVTVEIMAENTGHWRCKPRVNHVFWTWRRSMFHFCNST